MGSMQRQGSTGHPRATTRLSSDRFTAVCQRSIKHMNMTGVRSSTQLPLTSAVRFTTSVLRRQEPNTCVCEWLARFP